MLSGDLNLINRKKCLYFQEYWKSVTLSKVIKCQNIVRIYKLTGQYYQILIFMIQKTSNTSVMN